MNLFASCQFIRQCFNSDRLIIFSTFLLRGPGFLELEAFPLFLGYSPAEAAVSLSAPRLSGIAAAILQVFQFQPIIL